MKKHHLLNVIALISLLTASVAGLAHAARLELVINPSWEYYPTTIEQGVKLGSAVAGVGFVNDDSYADILVGAEKRGNNREGWAGLFLGGPNGPESLPDWQVFGEVKGSLFGAVVDGAGYINDDTYMDFIVGAPAYNGDQAGEGAVYVYYGSPTLPSTTPDWRQEGNLPNISFGASVAGAGYLNADDYADIVVGAPQYSTDTLSNAGAFYIYYGSADGPVDTLAGEPWDIGQELAGKLGSSVAIAGDVNGDGYDDVLVGEPYANNDILLDTGKVYLYLGGAERVDYAPSWSFTDSGFRGGDKLGSSVAGAGDLNGDDCPDVAIGAPGYNADGLPDAGRVYVFFGCQEGTLGGLNAVPDWQYSPPKEYSGFGNAVNGGGDTDLDTFDELLVGAHEFDDEQANEGAVFAFFGNPSGILDLRVWQVEGNKNDTEFGYAVDGAGDTDGDGLGDVVVGAPEFRVNEVIKGAAFLYFGSEEASTFRTYMPFLRK